MKRQPIIAAAGLAAVCLTSSVLGYIDLEVVPVDNSALLSGYETSDLQITTDYDWTSGALLLDLTSGSVYQHPYGGTFPTTNALLLAIFPELAFDTSVGVPGSSIAGGAGDVGGDAMAFSTSELDISFYNIDDTDTGTFAVSRITLTDDAAGTWRIALTEDQKGYARYEFSGSIVDGVVSFQHASMFNGMTAIEVWYYNRMQYLKALGVEFDEEGNQLPRSWTSAICDTPEPVTLSGNQPEPGTLAMVGLGLGGLMGRRR